jgi:hypothetical protein
MGLQRHWQQRHWQQRPLPLGAALVGGHRSSPWRYSSGFAASLSPGAALVGAITAPLMVVLVSWCLCLSPSGTSSVASSPVAWSARGRLLPWLTDEQPQLNKVECTEPCRGAAGERGSRGRGPGDLGWRRRCRSRRRTNATSSFFHLRWEGAATLSLPTSELHPAPSDQMDKVRGSRRQGCGLWRREETDLGCARVGLPRRSPSSWDAHLSNG